MGMTIAEKVFAKAADLDVVHPGQYVDCRVDRITYAFLKNGKADMSGITLLAEDVA